MVKRQLHHKIAATKRRYPPGICIGAMVYEVLIVFKALVACSRTSYQYLL